MDLATLRGAEGLADHRVALWSGMPSANGYGAVKRFLVTHFPTERGSYSAKHRWRHTWCAVLYRAFRNQRGGRRARWR